MLSELPHTFGVGIQEQKNASKNSDPDDFYFYLATEPSISNVSLGVVTGDINIYSRQRFLCGLIAPVITAYEAEKESLED